MSNGSRRRLSVRAPLSFSEPDISPVYKAVIERALRWAWQQVCVHAPEVLRTGTEEQISDKLAEVLNEHHATNHRRLAPGLASFETVVRGGKSRNHLGKIEKAPDLVFRPPARGVRIRDDWGLFVECKIVDGNSSLAKYCSHGLAKFCEGEYAYRMPSAGMLGYVRDSTRPYNSLRARLTATYRTKSHFPGMTDDICSSQHARNSLSRPCVDIGITHLWLDVPGPTGPSRG